MTYTKAAPLQAGMNNAELLAAWMKKLPGVEPTDRELSAFALGAEVGFDRAAMARSRSAYGCACLSRDSAECHRMRYGIVDGDLSHGDEECECLCHQRKDEE